MALSQLHKHTQRSLVGGVSQQDSSVRLESQCEAQLNGDSNPIRGLSKRSPSEFLVKTPLGITDKPFVHYIDNVGDEQYVIMIEDGALVVYDELGVAKTLVNDLPDDDYLGATADSRDAFRAITVEDTTFILNKEVVPGMGGFTTTENGANFQKMVRLVYTGFNVDYIVTIDGISVTYTSGDGQSGVPAVDDIENKFSTVLTGLKTLIDGTAYPGKTIVCVVGSETLLIYENTGTPVDFTLTVDSSTGDSLKAIDTFVDNFSDLPGESFQNQRVRIRGDISQDQDDYYVKFQRDSGIGTLTQAKGRWEEAIGFGVAKVVDIDTMPIKLTREADGITFTLAEIEWDDRLAGDDDTNEIPSFFDKNIDNLFWHKGRLGFLSGNRITLTEAGVPTNLFRTTVITLLDSDRIDFAANDTKSGDFLWAKEFNEELILFTGRGQHVLPNKEVLSPNTIEVNTATHFTSEPACEPLLIGKYLMFAESNGDFAGIREYFVDPQIDTKDSALITGHIPEYIEGSVIQLAGDSTMQAAFVLVDDNGGTLYAYRFYWVGSEKVQSSWSKWTIAGADEILSIGVVGKYLMLVVRRGDDVFLERIHLGVNETVLPLVDLQESFSGGGITDNMDGSYEVTLSYTPGDSTLVRVVVDGVELDMDPDDGPVDLTALPAITIILAEAPTEIVVGYVYSFQYIWSEVVVRTQTQEGQLAADSSVQKLLIRDMVVRYSNTKEFTLRTTMPNRNEQTKTFSSTTEANGDLRFSVLGNSKDTQFYLESDSAMPVQIINTTWMLMPNRITIPA